MITRVLAVDDPAWSDALLSLPHDVYHLPEYLRIESRRQGANGQAFVAREGDRCFFVPFLTRSCSSVAPSAASEDTFDAVSPYGYPGILVSPAAQDDAAFLVQAWRALADALRNLRVCAAFLRQHPILMPRTLFDQLEVPTSSSETVAVDISVSQDEIWKDIRRGHRSTIRRAQRLGFAPCVVPCSGQHLLDFIAIYRETMDRVAAAEEYYFGDEYFESLAALGDHVHLGIVERDGEIAAGNVFFECGGLIQSHLAGTRNKFLNEPPFHLLLHHIMLWAKSRGNRLMHVGGGLGGERDSLFTFKTGFSSGRYQFTTIRLILDEGRYCQLVTHRADQLGVSSHQLLQSRFFPAYRTPTLSACSARGLPFTR